MSCSVMKTLRSSSCASGTSCESCMALWHVYLELYLELYVCYCGDIVAHELPPQC